MAKRTTNTNATAQPGPALPAEYILDGEAVQPMQLYHNRGIWKSDTPPGVWMDEPSKIAWQDEATGLDCIIRREWSDCLGGYVGMDERHPLFGYGCRALNNAFDIQVHGGLTYSRACDEAGPEDRRVCHIGEPGQSHSEMWWVGFECDHSYDRRPRLPSDHPTEIHGAYRDINYVYRQTTQLAAQIHAIANGKPMPELASPPPPIALDHRDLGRA